MTEQSFKLLYVADWHLRGTSPRNRLDDYPEAIKTKLLEVFQIATEHKVKAIIQPGDIWDIPEVATGVLLQFADLLADHCPVPIYSTYGQHDVYSYNSTTFNRTSLALLERIVPQLKVVRSPSEPVHLTEGDMWVQLTFTPHSKRVDVDGYGYSPEVESPMEGALKIHVTHGMLLDHEPPFPHFSLIEDVPTTADLVLTGDYHPGYGVYHRKRDNVTFCNPGALCRQSASTGEIERPIQVALIEVLPGKQFDIQLIQLKSAKPGSEVLDRSRIEAEQKRQYAMESFSALMKTQAGDKVLLNIEQIVGQIGEAKNFAPEIVDIALEKIDLQRQKRAGVV